MNLLRWAAAVVASACLLALSQPPAGIWPLAGVALIPWFWALRGASVFGALIGSFALGTASGCLAAVWIPEALKTLGSSGVYAFLGLIMTAAWAKGVPYTLLGGAFHAARAWPPWARVTTAAVGFMAVEWLQSAWRWGVPWALLGHSQLPAAGVAQLAAVAGVPLISGLLAAVSCALWLVCEGDRRQAVRLAASLIAAWSATALFGLALAERIRPQVSEFAPSIRLLVVQPNLPREERWAPSAQALNLERAGRYTLADRKNKPGFRLEVR